MKLGETPSSHRWMRVRWALALAVVGLSMAGAPAVAAPPAPGAVAPLAAQDRVLAAAPVLEAADVAAAAAAQLPVPLQPHPEREWWVWGALCFALLLLAFMIWSLFASLRKGRGRSYQARP